MAKSINVLLTSFPGLGLPQTLSLSLPPESTCCDLRDSLSDRLPPNVLDNNRFILTTNAHRNVSLSSTKPLATLLSDDNETLLPLRLSLPLCGGKGGFGSQLRAAGGRMASRKKRAGDADPQGSNRNLDGRRLRTVTEAKALAEYLAVKPEMEKREKEERYKRWEAVVQAAERKEEELKAGKKNARVDEKWKEGKEEAENKTREAVLKALRKGKIEGVAVNLEGSGSEEVSGDDEEEAGSSSSGSKSAGIPPERKFFGWDEEEDEDSDEEGEDEISAKEVTVVGKGKAKA